MPLKLRYGKPPVPPRKGQLLTTKNIMKKVKKDSKDDAAFVTKKMTEFYKNHQLRGDKAKPTEIQQLRARIHAIPPSLKKRTPMRSLPSTLKRRTPPPRIKRGGKTRRKRRRKKKKTRRRKKKKTRRRRKMNMRGCSKKRRRR